MTEAPSPATPAMAAAPSAALRAIRIALLALGTALPLPAAALGPEACEAAADEAARLSGVPVAVLRAITLTETGQLREGRFRPWPWAVNREGQGHWFATREEALAFARASLGEARPSFDLGCFQINFRFHGEGFPSLEAMVDPTTGALYAARFLRGLHAELGDWSAAAGAYHSRTPELARRYRGRFDRILAGLGGSAGAPAAAEARWRPSGTVRRVPAPRIITVVRSGGGFVAERVSPGEGASGRVISVGPKQPLASVSEPAPSAARGSRSGKFKG